MTATLPMADSRKIALSPHIEIEWLEGRTARALCPNCGTQGQVRQMLDIVFNPPDPHEDEHRFIVQTCPACAVRFVDNTMMMDYSTERLIQLGWDSYQVQLGAGIWPITAQLAALDKPRGAKVLEIGGAFGFGLDFCIRARGWDGVGYDPSPLAAFGLQELGLPLKQEYFAVRHLELGPWDVAVATELLEHISYPIAFLLIMRRALGETGVLILSTPDADFINPATPAASLLPLLSPGAHTVLQTEKSLDIALRAAGFFHTRIVHDGTSLVAYASAAPFTLLEDQVARRATYRHYLVERARISPEHSDLRLGFAGRGIFESANDGDWAAADAAWDALLPAVKLRFGLDLNSMTALPAGAADTSLAELCGLMPLGLGMILFGRAMRLLQAGQSRAQLEPLLRLAAEAVDALLDALAQRSLVDGLSASLGELLRTELLICAAAAGRPEVVAQVSALGNEEISWRVFVELVSAGEITVAAALRETLPELPAQSIPAGLTRNILLSLVNFHLAQGGDTRRALSYVAALQANGDNTDDALLSAFTGLVNAGQLDEAEALLAREPVLQNLDTMPGAHAEGARWAELIFLLQRRPLEAARKAAARSQAARSQGGSDAARLAAIYTDGFIRLVNSGSFAEAQELAAGLEPYMALCPPAARLDALISLLFLDAQPGGGTPENVPARLEALRTAGVDELRLTELAFNAFSMLVNQAAYAPARALLPVVDPALIKLRPPLNAVAWDALFAAGMLFLQQKDDLRRGAASFARLRDALVKQTPKDQPADPLFWSALRGEVIALHQLNRGAEATSILRAFLDAYPDAPEDLREQLKGRKKP